MVAGEGSHDALEAVRRKALALGAVEAVLIDARERFISGYAMRALAANALYEGVYPLSAALSRPLIADLLVETAAEYGADAVAHGCTGKGNDQVRIEVGVRAAAPHLTTLAPLREHPLSRPDAIAYAQAHGVPIAHTAAKPYSVDANLWGRSIEAGVLENPWNAPPEDAYAWTAAPEREPPNGERGRHQLASAACRRSTAPRARRWSLHAQPDRGRERRRPHRHDRGSRRRPQVARSVRMPGQRDADRGAQGARAARADARRTAHQVRRSIKSTPS
jgi:hypothetical protein